MVRKLILSLAILSLLVGSAIAQKGFDTRLGLGLTRNDYPGWYLTSENSSSDTSWYIRDSSFCDTSLVYWTKPGWEVFTAIQTDYTVDSSDSNSMYVIMQYSVDQVDWATHDTTEIVGSATVTFTDWAADGLAMRYFRFIVKPRPDSIFQVVTVTDTLVAVSVTDRDSVVSDSIQDLDSASWIIEMSDLTDGDDWWNGGQIESLDGSCSSQVALITDWDSTGGGWITFAAFSACTLSVGDSLSLTLPHPDSSYEMVVWADSSKADDYWNGGDIWFSDSSSACDDDSSTVVDWDSTGNTGFSWIIKYTSISGCSPTAGDTITLRIPHTDSSFSIYGKIFTREP